MWIVYYDFVNILKFIHISNKNEENILINNIEYNKKSFSLIVAKKKYSKI